MSPLDIDMLQCITPPFSVYAPLVIQSLVDGFCVWLPHSQPVAGSISSTGDL